MEAPLHASSYEGSLEEGASNAQLIYDDDHKIWVVKSLHSTQGGLSGERTLFNDYVASRIAASIELPVPQVRIIFVDESFLTAYPFLREPENGNFSPGMHFASEYKQGFTLRSLRRARISERAQYRVINGADANGFIAYDTWSFNADRASGSTTDSYLEKDDNILLETVGGNKLKMQIIDQGLAFGGAWHCDPNGSPVQMVGQWPHEILGHMDIFFQQGWTTLPECLMWIKRLQAVTFARLQAIVDEVPHTWRTRVTVEEIDKLLLYLIHRASVLERVFYRDLPSLDVGATQRSLRKS